MNDPIDPRRRHVLAMMGALGAGALVGGTLESSARGLLPVVAAADALKPGPSVALPRHSIDVHAHFFNASDESAVGYFLHSELHTHPRVQRFMELMKPVLVKLVSTAPTARAELASLRSMYAQKLAPAAMEALLQRQERDRRQTIAHNLAAEMRRQHVAEKMGPGSPEKGLESVPQSKDELLLLLDPDRADDSTKALGGVGGTTIAGLIRFMGCMLQERGMNLRIYRRGHGERGSGIEAAFGALVDFNYFYKDLSRSPLDDQIELHSLLAKQSGGFMLPLFAYNPWADIKAGGTVWLDKLCKAVNEKGFIGAKIYPPVGFRPYGNTKAPKGLDPHALDAALKAFFLRCADLGIPVMAHANSTQGYDDAADDNSAPEGWRDLIKAMAADHKVPLVNLGHFGGNGGEGPGGKSNNWPLRFAQLMGEEGGKHFYGDLAIWTGLRECLPGGDQGDCKLARDRLQEARRAFAGLDQRLMYGSDWFMMIKERDWQRWPLDIASALGGLPGIPADYLHRVFHQNAMECFGLTSTGQNYTRLHKFFGGNLPVWMSATP